MGEETTIPEACGIPKDSPGCKFTVVPVTRPKSCPYCLSENEKNKSVITKHNDNCWKCKECGHTWR